MDVAPMDGWMDGGCRRGVAQGVKRTGTRARSDPGLSTVPGCGRMLRWQQVVVVCRSLFLGLDPCRAKLPGTLQAGRARRCDKAGRRDAG